MATVKENAEKRKLGISTTQHVIVTDLQYSHLKMTYGFEGWNYENRLVTNNFS